LKAWATKLGLAEVKVLLDATLQEEKKADALLTKLAEQTEGKRAA
jgi:ferritin-like metal-binding protein YciE